MRTVFAYARVSTPRQGEKGVSLTEQREAITRYAERHGLQIIRWFEEQESASKRGRPAFNQMLRLLRRGAATGIVIHKIDRSARNLEDWNDIGKLVDAGVDVHFATESIDLTTTAGRLSADIQAVVATQDILKRYDRPLTCFYLDPPYFQRYLYRHNLEPAEFGEMAERLGKLKAKFVLSLNDVPQVRALFRRFHMKEVELPYTAQKKSGRRYRELLITN